MSTQPISINQGAQLQAMPVCANHSVTMTSLELVDYINSQRDATDTAVLRHSHLTAKVPTVLGEKAAATFMASAFYTVNGATRERNIYNFPKREACLMAMSYSYDLQAKVYDHMTALENQQNKATLPDFTNPVTAARAWADQFEKSSNATIANQQHVLTLSVIEHKHDTFKDVRGCGKTYATINEMTKATGIRHGFWALKKWCDERGVERKEVQLTNEIFTYAYPDTAWMDVHGLELTKIFGEKV